MTEITGYTQDELLGMSSILDCVIEADRDMLRGFMDGAETDGADDLGHDIGQQLLRREAAAGPEADRDRRIQVAPRDVPDGEGHRQHREAEGKRDTKKADPDVGEGRRKNRRIDIVIETGNGTDGETAP